jgi:hypothetical protein
MIEGSQPRRRLLLALGSIGAAALASCSSGQDDEPSAAATLANHEKIVDALTRHTQSDCARNFT